jgi:C4-dicarboxylate transporter DctM subunit
MSPIDIGIAGMILLLFFFFLGMPISLSFALSGVIGFCFVSNVEAGLSLLAIETFSNLSNYGLTVIPMFVLMGAIGFHSGMSGRLFGFGLTLFGRTRGGLALASCCVGCFCRRLRFDGRHGGCYRESVSP